MKTTILTYIELGSLKIKIKKKNCDFLKQSSAYSVPLESHTSIVLHSLSSLIGVHRKSQVRPGTWAS